MPCFLISFTSWWSMFLIALLAVHRSVAAWLEWHLAFFAAVCTYCFVHFPGWSIKFFFFAFVHIFFIFSFCLWLFSSLSLLSSDLSFSPLKLLVLTTGEENVSPPAILWIIQSAQSKNEKEFAFVFQYFLFMNIRGFFYNFFL